MTSHIASSTLAAFARGAAFAAALGFAAPAVAGGHDVTLLLKSGERVTGELASLDGSNVDVKDTDGEHHAVSVSEVVLMDFLGGARLANRSEIDQARGGAGHLVVLYDGTTRSGHVVDIVDEGGAEAVVVFDSTDGRRDQIPLNDVNRLYLQPIPADVSRTLGITSE